MATSFVLDIHLVGNHLGSSQAKISTQWRMDNLPY